MAGLWRIFPKYGFWTLARHFPKRRIRTVTAWFQDATGAWIRDPSNNKEIEVSCPINVLRSTRQALGSRGRIELLQLLVVVVIAVLGLMGGAHDQLEKLDVVPGLIAVFLLGYSADSIKNVLKK
jgi:hypothetical protein